MDGNNLEKILKDIYETDPELKEKEQEIVEIVLEMLRKKPEVEPDEQFVGRLRKILKEKIDSQDARTPLKTGIGFYKVFFPSAVLLALIFCFTFIILENNKILRNVDIEVNEKGEFELKNGYFTEVKITELNDNAFGFRDSSSYNVKEDLNIEEEKLSQDSLSFGTGGGGSPLKNGSSIAMPYVGKNYVYVYNGEDFFQGEEKMNILKRIVDEDLREDIGDFAEEMNLGVMNISSFGNLKVNNMNLSEDVDYGYQINIDFARGIISLYRNWNKWPNNYGNCSDKYCSEYSGLRPSDMPEEKEIIERADSFLSNHQINTDIYGAPIIVENQFYTFEQSSYIPEEVMVIYPLEINGLGVYESYGNRYGLNVRYNIREKKISELSGLTTQNYQSSLYEVETDVDKIIEMVENRSDYPDGYELETIEIELEYPLLAYVRYLDYNNYEENEYLVPSFVFPVKEYADDIGFYRDNIVVPLVKDFMQ